LVNLTKEKHAHGDEPKATAAPSFSVLHNNGIDDATVCTEDSLKTFRVSSPGQVTYKELVAGRHDVERLGRRCKSSSQWSGDSLKHSTRQKTKKETLGRNFEMGGEKGRKKKRRVRGRVE